MSRTTLARAALAALGTTVALVLTACGASEEAGSGGHGAGHSTSDTSASSNEAAQERNDADVTFAQQMIPHHQQAIEMADLVATRTTNESILALASQIKAAQDPEIQQMTTLLQTWEAAIPTGAAMPGMDHGSHGADSGMMTDDEMQALSEARDSEFDRQWVSMMIRHHDGAIDMANTQLREGVNPDAKALAQQIIDTQETEIRDMQALLPQG